VHDNVRVAHVTTAHPVRDIRIFHKECVALARAGLDVHLVAVADQDEKLDGVTINHLPRRRGRLCRMIFGPVDAWRTLHRLQPNLVHVHDPELIPLAVIWQIVHRRPAIYDAHEDLAKQVAGKPYLPRWARPVVARLSASLERCADRWLSGIIAATPAISRNYSNRQLALVQNFPWSASFASHRELGSEHKDAVYIGAISTARGLQQMITLAETSHPEGNLILAGSLATSHADDIESALGVHYYGTLSAAEIPNLLAGARVGLALFHPLPNNLESQPTKIYEYMAAGRPFIASNFPAWMAQFGPHRCGIFVDPTDDRAIARAVNLVRSDDQLATAMGQRGRLAWERHFCFEAEAERLLALTRNLLSSHAHRYG